jgi:hypothetical protein
MTAHGVSQLMNSEMLNVDLLSMLKNMHHKPAKAITESYDKRVSPIANKM